MPSDRQLLTSSRMRSFRDCQRLHHLRYVEGWQPVRTAEALRFGTLIHVGLEAWWSTVSDPDTPHAALSEALATVAGQAADPYEQARVEELLRGYDAAWRPAAPGYEVLAVEAEFRAPLLNPGTWRPSQTWTLGGKIDLVLRERASGRVLVVEHKTSSETIEGDGSYWSKLSMDHQISAYVVGAESLGWQADEILYDVLGKPGIRPLRATPPESRKFRKDGALYAGQREVDETPDEYRARLREAIAAEPDRHFQQRRIPRTQSQVEDFLYDAWMQAAAMRESARLGRAPRNPDACHRFGTCSFWPVCSAGASPDALPGEYRRSSDVNPELQPQEV